MKTEQFKNVKLSLIISLLVILYGFTLGGLFGAYENNIKSYLNTKAEIVFETVYNGDLAIKENIVSKGWEYFKHSHTHALGLGSISLILIVFFSFFSINSTIKYITSMMISLGALGYTLYWTIAALKAPIIGNTELTKETLSYIAVPAAGLSLIGLLLLIILIVYKFCKCSKA